MLVTSDKHLPRALWIFRRLFGKNIEFDGVSTACGDLLNLAEEREYLALVKKHFRKMPREIPIPVNWDRWYNQNIELYQGYTEVHAKYLKGKKETNQAYMGVRKI